MLLLLQRLVALVSCSAIWSTKSPAVRFICTQSQVPSPASVLSHFWSGKLSTDHKLQLSSLWSNVRALILRYDAQHYARIRSKIVMCTSMNIRMWCIFSISYYSTQYAAYINKHENIYIYNNDNIESYNIVYIYIYVYEYTIWSVMICRSPSDLSQRMTHTLCWSTEAWNCISRRVAHTWAEGQVSLRNCEVDHPQCAVSNVFHKVLTW